MRYITARELLSEEIQLRDICIVPVREMLGQEGVFKGKKRHCHVLFLYLEGQRIYTTEDGRSFSLNPGEILYVPQYASYSFRIVEAADNGCDYAIALNFEMSDADGNAVALSDAPHILLRNCPDYHIRFHRLLKADSGDKHNRMLLKSMVYSLFHDILNDVHLRDTKQSPWELILPAIEAIESQPARDIPIPELAARCGVCETRFRQLFREYTGGLSPVAYRNHLRLNLVERMLYTEQVTVETAAREAGFRDMSHFYRLYRKRKAEK